MQPFTIAVADEVLADLDRRLAATRWADDFANDDWRYGVNVAYLKTLVDHWRHDYDWRERERQMNALPQFTTEVDGLRIHFVHRKGEGPKPIPLILTHGWPWTFWDFRKVVGPLADPAAHGGDPADAFDVVVPSLPGYGFSTPLTRPGINWWKTADLWVSLMGQLGYERFAAQGGDWGSFITAQLGHKHAERMIGVHIHTPSFLDLTTGRFDKNDFTEAERPNLHTMAAFAQDESGYLALQRTKPMTPAVGLNDSPAGLLGWLVEKRRSWSDCAGEVERRFSKDELIDLAMLYWVTGSYGTSARFYYEAFHDPWKPSHDRQPVVEAPTAIAVMPHELLRPPRKWAERYYNLQRWTPMPAGGHFAAAEEPQAIVEDLRAFFRDKR